LPLTRLKRGRRSFLGKIEHTGARFIVTDYGEAVAELGPISPSARSFMAEQASGVTENEDTAPDRTAAG
jgi:hypothetical protein